MIVYEDDQEWQDLKVDDNKQGKVSTPVRVKLNICNYTIYSRQKLKSLG